MSSTILGLAAASLSSLLIAVLCSEDPKRRRITGRNGGMAPRWRRLVASLATLPGLWCALQGDASTFLIWLGGAALAGWAAAASAGRVSRIDADRTS